MLKNIPDDYCSRLDISEENISELKDIAVEAVQNKTQEKQRLKKINRVTRHR